MDLLEKVYREKWILEVVEEAVGQAAYNVLNTDSLENAIYGRITRYVKEDVSKLNHRGTIIRFIFETASDYKKRYKVEQSIVFSALAIKGENEELIEFEPVDETANSIEDLIVKEITSILPIDPKRTHIINAWTEGETNNTNIARELVDTFGGNVEAHRKFIARFRDECRNILTEYITL